MVADFPDFLNSNVSNKQTERKTITMPNTMTWLEFWFLVEISVWSSANYEFC